MKNIISATVIFWLNISYCLGLEQVKQPTDNVMQPVATKQHQEGVIEIKKSGVSSFFIDISDKTKHYLMFWSSNHDIKYEDPDQWEDFNRAIYSFNSGVDKHFLHPIASAYREYTPQPIQTGISNFFANLNDVNTLVNNILQLNVDESIANFSRLAFNTTLGVVGLFEVVPRPKQKEDFGQTLGVWGIDSGPYLVLPFLGPSTLRDSIGIIPNIAVYDNSIDYITNENTQSVAVPFTNIVQTRANLIPLTNLLEKSEDPYLSVRDAYLQKRTFDIANGDLPIDDEEF